MSDFLYTQQCDDMIDGQYYMGDYQPTEQDLADMNEAWGNDFPDAGRDFFCAHCGHVELVYSQSPDETLCSDCYKYTTGIDEPDYPETEADVYQDAFYDQEPEDLFSGDEW